MSAATVGVPIGLPVNDTAATAYPVLDQADAPLPVAVPLGTTLSAEDAVRLSEKQRAELLSRGFPPGLVKQLELSCNTYPVRFFVLDNSGSMNASDGTRLHRKADGTFQTVQSTRWEELFDSVATIADMTETLGVRSDFHLLNGAAGCGQFLSVGATEAASFVPSVGAKLSASELKNKVRWVTPSGTTPLTEAVQQIISQIEPAAAQMRASGQQAVVTLMTDGLPNDKASFAMALRTLQALPVWLVVRLCTNDDDIVGYWDALDAQLEAGLEVLDDEAGEAAEVTGKNRWLSYGPPLHIVRTFGLSHKLFDLLDEHTLAPSQARAFCELLLGRELPEPQIEPEAFAERLADALSEVAAVYDPFRKCSRPWVDAQALTRLASGQGAEEDTCIIL